MTQDYNLYNQAHKSIIMWKGRVFEFAEPVDEKELKAFFDNNKQAPYFGGQQQTDLQNMKVQVFFHGAGDDPQNCAKKPNYIYQSLCDDSTIYYFPNNQMKQPTGWFDKRVGKWIKYPSTKDAQENGADATKTLTTICHKICKHPQVKNIIPCFKGASAGVYTMLSCVKGFVNECINANDLLESVCMLRQNVNLQKIPIAGYKGATPEESAQLLYDIDKDLSGWHQLSGAERLKYIYEASGVKNPNDDRYVLDICDDDASFLRLHSINNTKRFLKYLNDNCMSDLNDNRMSVPMKIVCHESSPSFTKEKEMLEEIKNGKYKNIPNVQLCAYDSSGNKRIIFNSLTDQYPATSNTRVLPCCLDFAYGLVCDDKHNTSIKNGNVSFDLKKSFSQKEKEPQVEC